MVQAGIVGRSIFVDTASVDQLARTGTRHRRPWTALDLLESPATRERSAGRRVIKELMDA
ncbi:MAG TPA: hypothetical protein DIT15_07830 [Arthrobacter bacterium]|nr:hypothetical protein [Arthrobacter sp.]HAP90544.1 hypothetical protein [Arthrobacter sp.]HBH58424.1 hypothetical protein [Arthrobacter sp.]HCB56983.1 hypothetical protein [Arthrobacter sp.]HCC38705.1 hypothetical protein [Arthrobacter sp.]